jgi:hypothetical protein
MKKNKKRREEEKIRKMKRKDLKDTYKGFKNAEHLSEKLKKLNTDLDSYLAKKISPVMKRKKKKKQKEEAGTEKEKQEEDKKDEHVEQVDKPKENEPVEMERESLKRYKKIGVNSKWMREYDPRRLNPMNEPKEIPINKDVEEMFKVKQRIDPEEMKGDAVIMSTSGDTEEAPKMAFFKKKNSPVEVNQESDQIENLDFNKNDSKNIFDDVQVLGKIGQSSSKKIISLKSEIKNKMTSGFMSQEFGYNSAFDKSEDMISDNKASPRSHLIENVETSNIEEDELLSIQKISNHVMKAPVMAKPEVTKKQISISVLNQKQYLEMNNQLSNISSDSENQLDNYFTWKNKENKSVPLKLQIPSTVFDIEEEKERLKYEKLIQQEKEIKEKIRKQKQLELQQIIEEDKKKKFQTDELDEFLKELENTNKKLEKYMKLKKEEKREKKIERRKQKMMLEAQKKIDEEVEQEVKERKDEIGIKSNKKYLDEDDSDEEEEEINQDQGKCQF